MAGLIGTVQPVQTGGGGPGLASSAAGPVGAPSTQQQTLQVPPSNILPTDPRVQPSSISGSVPWGEAFSFASSPNPNSWLVQSANSTTGWLLVQRSGPSSVVTDVPVQSTVTVPLQQPQVPVPTAPQQQSEQPVTLTPEVVTGNLADQWGQLLDIVEQIVSQVITAINRQQAILNRIVRTCCKPVEASIAVQQQALIPPLTILQSDCQRRLNEQAIRIDMLQQLLQAPQRPIQVSVELQYPTLPQYIPGVVAGGVVPVCPMGPQADGTPPRVIVESPVQVTVPVTVQVPQQSTPTNNLFNLFVQGGTGPILRYLGQSQGTGGPVIGPGMLPTGGGPATPAKPTSVTYYVVLQNVNNPEQVKIQVNPTPIKVGVTVDNDFKVVNNLSSAVGWDEDSATVWATANATAEQQQQQTQQQTTNVTLSPTQQVTVNTTPADPVVDLYEQPLAFFSGQYDQKWIAWAEGFFGPEFTDFVHSPSYADVASYLFKDAPMDTVGPNGLAAPLT